MVRGGFPEGSTCEQVYLSDGRECTPGDWGSTQKRPGLELGWHVLMQRKSGFVWTGNSERRSGGRSQAGHPDHVNAALQTMVRHWIHSKNTGQPLDGLGQGSDKG